MFFYAPKILGAGRKIDDLALQVDLFPTLMGLLNRSYVNNTLGIDLLRDHRKMVYFSANSTVAALNDSLLLIRRDNGEKSLFDHRNLSLENLIGKYPSEADDLERYALSNFQTSIWMLKTGKGKFEK
jgi:phosphoglycerol transferase MdoB-like AlkP superfamily enzyme